MPYGSDALRRRTVALIFQKPSTRTRVSFEAGIAELGGYPMVLRTDELQLSRGESVRDTAYVLSRHAAAIGIRTGRRCDGRAEFAEHATCPGDQHAHPPPPPLPGAGRPDDPARGVRAARGPHARLRRRRQQRGALADRAWGRWPGSKVRVASPDGYQLEPGRAGAADRRPGRGGARRRRRLHRRVGEHGRRPRDRGRAPPQRSRPTASTTHCSTARRPAPSRCTACPPTPGRRSPKQVLYGQRQRIWDQAENRRHAQKALLELLVGE